MCPINGCIVCEAIIKIGALNKLDPYSKPENFSTHFLFTWSIETDVFDIEDTTKLLPSDEVQEIPEYSIPKNKDVLILDVNRSTSKKVLRDYSNCYEVCLGHLDGISRPLIYLIDGYSSDSD